MISNIVKKIVLITAFILISINASTDSDETQLNLKECIEQKLLKMEVENNLKTTPDCYLSPWDDSDSDESCENDLILYCGKKSIRLVDDEFVTVFIHQHQISFDHDLDACDLLEVHNLKSLKLIKEISKFESFPIKFVFQKPEYDFIEQHRDLLPDLVRDIRILEIQNEIMNDVEFLNTLFQQHDGLHAIVVNSSCRFSGKEFDNLSTILRSLLDSNQSVLERIKNEQTVSISSTQICVFNFITGFVAVSFAEGFSRTVVLSLLLIQLFHFIRVAIRNGNQ